MLAIISAIPTTVREGFDVQDLPHRATSVSAEQMNKVFGGCKGEGGICISGAQCCYKNAAGQRLACDGWVPNRRCVPR